MRVRDAKLALERREQERLEEAARVVRLKREDEKRQEREQREAAYKQQVAMQLSRLADTVVGAGIVATRAEFESLPPAVVERIRTLATYVDELGSDLLNAMDKNALAEKGVAYGRPAAAGASVLALFGGYGWAGLAFGAIAAGARWMSDDWKKAQIAQFQAKWMRTMSTFDADDAAVFAQLFAYKHPMLATQLSQMQGHLPS